MNHIKERKGKKESYSITSPSIQQDLHFNSWVKQKDSVYKLIRSEMLHISII